MFFRHQDNKTTILIVYVDDIILIRDDVDGMKRLKGALATEFKIKDLIEVLSCHGGDKEQNRYINFSKKYIL